MTTTEHSAAASSSSKKTTNTESSGQQQQRNVLKVDDDLRQQYSGMELFEQVSTRSIQVKEAARSNRCPRCWHDATLRCICPMISSLLLPSSKEEEESSSSVSKSFLSSVKVLVLMHYKEYLSAGDDAKLLLAMLPNPQNAELFVFGRIGDWQRFQDEVSIDPIHTLTLWPGEGALTVDEFFQEALPDESPWKKRNNNTIETTKASSGNDDNISSSSPPLPLPTLRVIVLDGVYSHARNMFKTMKKTLLQENFPKFVALHPNTLSVYHRAQKNYATASAQTVSKSKDPKALHICTVEAYALLLKELSSKIVLMVGNENDNDNNDESNNNSVNLVTKTTEALVRAVTINNEALVHSINVRPASGVPTSVSSGAAKRSRKKQEAKAKKETGNGSG